MRKSLAIVAVLLFPSQFLAAQAPAAPATIMTMEHLRSIGESLRPTASRTEQLGRGSGYTYAVTHRDSSGTVEMHADWTDVFVVQSGTATLLTGGVAEGARETAAGEWRGGTARGATRAAIKPGDVIVIPAKTPHQVLLSPGEQISYLGFKIRVAP
jgi:mannose-6-phosphate isomerase-like protein (cupin superfamily)